MTRPRPSPASILQQVRLLRTEPARVQLAAILDGLDTWRAVEGARAAAPRLLAWGPKAVSGITPSPWVGVVMWARAPGYDGYRVLTLRGVWVVQEGEAVRVMAGVKRLAYSAPFYEAEAYHKLIRKNFDLYYADDGAPPAHPTLDTPYDEARRLELRERVKGAMLGAN
jgi:hypothetical protein